MPTSIKDTDDFVTLEAMLTHTKEQATTLAAKGVKYDTSKLRLELIAPEIEIALGAALTYGAVKYQDRNWEKGFKWSRAFGALKRHLNARHGGEQCDPETGIPHTWLAAAELMFLIAFEERTASLGKPVGIDDMPKSEDTGITRTTSSAYAMLARALDRLHNPPAKA